MAVIGVIPAAGFHTSSGPDGPSEEMILVNGRPVMDYCVDRMQFVNPDSIRMVTRAGKKDLIANATHLGLEVVLAETVSPAHSIAVGIDDLGTDDIVLMAFAHSLWDPLNGFQPLLEDVLAGSEISLGLFQTSQPERSDVVLLGGANRVQGVLVKPPDPPSDHVWGAAAARQGALVGIEAFDEPGEFFDLSSRRMVVTGVHLSDRFVDIGSPRHGQR